MARLSGACREADLRVELAAAEVEAVIPPRVSSIAEIAYDQNAYGLRYLIECFINKIKHCRRVATRYEKTARNFLSMVMLTALMIWLPGHLFDVRAVAHQSTKLSP